MKKVIGSILGILLAVSISYSQRAEITLSLNEQFFDALLDSVYLNFEPPSFPIKAEKTSGCDESIKIVREMNGVRTAVRFREGKIYMPLAFTGKYSAPFVVV